MAELTEEDRAAIKELAETFYDLFRSAPISCNVNGQLGKAAFFGRDAQQSQAQTLLRTALERAREAARVLEFDPLMLPEDMDAAHIYQVAWADYQRKVGSLTIAELLEERNV